MVFIVSNAHLLMINRLINRINLEGLHCVSTLLKDAKQLTSFVQKLIDIDPELL